MRNSYEINKFTGEKPTTPPYKYLGRIFNNQISINSMNFTVLFQSNSLVAINGVLTHNVHEHNDFIYFKWNFFRYASQVDSYHTTNDNDTITSMKLNAII